MKGAGEKLTLEAFLARIAPELDDNLDRKAADLRAVADHLSDHLAEEPALQAQVSKFRAALPTGLATMSDDQRLRTVKEAGRAIEDIRTRWIDADAPPLVDEIDMRLDEMRTGLETLRLPGPDRLRDAARQIDRLGRVGAALENAELRYLPWTAGAAVLFVIGMTLFLAPGLVASIPMLGSFWTVIFCLGALPAVAIHYAWAVLPRSRADAEIDALNQSHFMAHGGLYFPETPTTSAGVVIVGPLPALSDGAQARKERRAHREKLGPFW